MDGELNEDVLLAEPEADVIEVLDDDVEAVEVAAPVVEPPAPKKRKAKPKNEPPLDRKHIEDDPKKIEAAIAHLPVRVTFDKDDNTFHMAGPNNRQDSGTLNQPLHNIVRCAERLAM